MIIGSMTDPYLLIRAVNGGNCFQTFASCIEVSRSETQVDFMVFFMFVIYQACNQTTLKYLSLPPNFQ